MLLIPNFFDPPAITTIAGAVESAAGAAAEVYGSSSGGAVDARTRSTKKLLAPESVRELVASAFTNARPALEQHFGIPLTSFEEPQFLRYGPGDFFVAHQDGNTGLIFDDSRHRRVSVVVFLNEGYTGGSLVLHRANEREIVPAAPGLLVAFPSETTHEVTPVTDGLRYTIVSWFRV